MNGRTHVEGVYGGHGPIRGPWKGHGRPRARGLFFGLDVDEMAPRVQVAAAVAVLAPVALSGLVLAFTPVWWIFTTYFWVAFPALGLLAHGIAGLSKGQTQMSSMRPSGEKEILEALWREGELTPARAAMATSLSVATADAALKELAEAGHLEVRARGGGIFYALWESGDGRPNLVKER